MLRSIELIGFKSFANKTTLEFPARVTGIVGPNGSGKSNVVDAFRWILGERGAQNLRSESQGSLIFSGSHKKAAMSFAEARLHFDNRNSVFPIEFSEFSIARRVERDGASRFFLNQEEVRLKDLIEMFARAKIGTKGVTIINQGEVDHFIKVTPEKRKELIEEAIGLKEYQLKRGEAMAKLTSAEQNLRQTKTLLDEITPHLRSLRRSAERYARRESIEAELANVLHSYFSFIYREVEEGVVRGERELFHAHGLVAEKMRVLEAEESKLKGVTVNADRSVLHAVKQLRREREQERNTLLEKLYALERELAKSFKEQKVVGEPSYAALRGVLAKVEETCETLLSEARVEALHTSLRDILKHIRGLFVIPHEEKDSLSLNTYEAKKRELEDAIHVLEQELEDLNKKEEEEERVYEEKTRLFSMALQNVDALRKDLFSLRAREDGLRLDAEKLRLRVENVKEKMREHSISFDAFLEKHRQTQLVSVESRVGLEEKIARYKRELASIGDADDALLAELKSTEDRYVFLTEQTTDLVRASEDLRKLITELDYKIKTDFDVATEKLNKEFTTAFGMLFDGGKSRLVVTKGVSDEAEGDMPMGVDIKIDLPRKKITSLDMLSGGERTLVALAFMSALVAVSEPPFLVLDEVDAALDEQNAVKFREIMKGLAKKTQFVIITHNRATMEGADVLYGVTMADDGISKILSLKLS